MPDAPGRFATLSVALFEAAEVLHKSRHRREAVRKIRSRTGMVFQKFNLFPRLSDFALESNTTTVLIAHEVADRMAIVHEENLIEEDPPSELVGGARDPRTRRFLEAVL